MTLDTSPSYPANRCYVVKIHRTATPATGDLHGRLEHLASGDSHEFHSVDELVRLLCRYATASEQPLAPASEHQS